MNFFRQWKDKRIKAAHQKAERSNGIRQELIKKFGLHVTMRANINQPDPVTDMILDLENNQVIYDTDERRHRKITEYLWTPDGYTLICTGSPQLMNLVRIGSGVYNSGYNYRVRDKYYGQCWYLASLDFCPTTPA